MLSSSLPVTCAARIAGCDRSGVLRESGASVASGRPVGPGASGAAEGAGPQGAASGGAGFGPWFSGLVTPLKRFRSAESYPAGPLFSVGFFRSASVQMDRTLRGARVGNRIGHPAAVTRFSPPAPVPPPGFPLLPPALLPAFLRGPAEVRGRATAGRERPPRGRSRPTARR